MDRFFIQCSTPVDQLQSFGVGSPKVRSSQLPSNKSISRVYLQPSESFYDSAGDQKGKVVVIDSRKLSELWNAELLDGFIVMQDQEPVTANAPEWVPPTIATGDVAFPLQNFFYAIQWWIFALFAVAVYVRWLIVGSKLRT